MAILITMRKGRYTNNDAVGNVIRYVTRTRPMEDRADELVAWGGWGIGTYQTPELSIEQFCRLQQIYRIETRGSRIFHEVLRMTEEEWGRLGYDRGRLFQIAANCTHYYYSQGHQAVFAVHLGKMDCLNGNRGLHIHFVVNTINFMTGNKWHSNIRENTTRQQIFNDIIWNFMDPDPFGLESLSD